MTGLGIYIVLAGISFLHFTAIMRRGSFLSQNGGRWCGCNPSEYDGVKITLLIMYTITAGAFFVAILLDAFMVLINVAGGIIAWLFKER